MFLKLNHYDLQVYQSAKQMRQDCYNAFSKFPVDERFNLAGQIRRASTSVLLNLAEGCARKSETERKRFFEISRSSLVEIDGCYDLAVDSGYFNISDLEHLEKSVLKTFILLSGMLKN